MPRSIELTQPDIIKVVVLVLENNQGDILLTQRSQSQHLPGYWEFPGGKIDSGESDIQALQRECKEELNYNTIKPKPILTIRHDYPAKSVELRVFHEISHNPQVSAAENQPMKWVSKADLSDYQLPAANQAILQYIQSNYS